MSAIWEDVVLTTPQARRAVKRSAGRARQVYNLIKKYPKATGNELAERMGKLIGKPFLDTSIRPMLTHMFHARCINKSRKRRACTVKGTEMCTWTVCGPFRLYLEWDGRRPPTAAVVLKVFIDNVKQYAEHLPSKPREFLVGLCAIADEGLYLSSAD